jgi:NAD(P)-dependent dehydrogenase (short-subunit alcohol dehydrogenase family)
VTGRLDGKVAIVTGGGSSPDTGVGIGQAIATVFAREGASVLIADKDATRGQATCDSMADQPGKSSLFVGDVTSEVDCDAMVRAAIDQFGGLDILINNAAISRHVAITETSKELLDEVMGINLGGSFFACKYAVPALVERGGGSIVNIGSVAGIRDSGTSHPAYCSSKAAQLGLTIDLAGAYGRSNVRVNAVLPGMVFTPMLQSVGRVDDEVRAHLNLLGRMGSAWDIAHAVLFLCSDEASYITGVVLPVDGGATAAMPGSYRRGL